MTERPTLKLGPIPPARKWANNLRVRVQDQELNLFLNCEEYRTVGSIVGLVSDKLNIDMEGLSPVVNNKNIELGCPIYPLRNEEIVFQEKTAICLNLVIGRKPDLTKLKLQVQRTQSLWNPVRAKLKPLLEQKGQKLNKLLLIRVCDGQRVLLSTVKPVSDLLDEDKIADGDVIEVRYMAVQTPQDVKKEKRQQISIFFGSAERMDTRQKQDVTPDTTFADVVREHPDVMENPKEYWLQPLRENNRPVRNFFIKDLKTKVMKYMSDNHVNSFVIVLSREVPPCEPKNVRCKIIQANGALAIEEFTDDATLTKIAGCLCDDVSKVSFRVNGKAITAKDPSLCLGDLAEEGDIEIVIGK